MRHKTVRPAKLRNKRTVKRSVSKLTGEIRSNAVQHKKIPSTDKWRLRWLKFYKLLACIAVCSIVMPYFEVLVSVGAGTYATVFTWIASALLFAAGYGIHAGVRHLFIKPGSEEEFSFSFETKWEFSSPSTLIPSLLLCALVSVAFSFGAGQILQALLYPYYNAEVGFPLMVMACIVASVLGALLVPFQFHQLCSLRTLIECLFAFGVPFGIFTFWANGVNVLFAACVLVYALCLCILMNQEYVIKPSYSSKTCYATRELRMQGMAQAFTLWLTAFVTSIMILGLLAVLVIPIRFFIYIDMNQVLDFPVKGMPALNGGIFFLGVVMIAVLSVLAIMRFVRPRNLKYWEKILREAWGKIMGFFFRLQYRHGKKKYNDMDFKEVVGERPKKTHYVDTVTQTQATTRELPLGYRAFLKALHAQGDLNGQYRYAYEVLMTDLYHAHIGIAKCQTPLEMADIIRRKTNIREMDRLTETFTAVVYGKDGKASQSDVDTVCGILRERLKA